MTLSPSASNGHPSVLIIDDDPTNLSLFSRLVESFGYRVYTASGAAKADVMLQRKIPDIILMDVMMPDVDGIELCRRFKNSPTTAETPIIVITAMSDPHSREGAFAAGADDFFNKPFKVEALQRSLSELTAERQAVRDPK